ncbi:MAG: PilZ domain-containing protein, partial [Desulfarculus sp.]|nr:PilZ domain-containing protein [Desulfarculus sp.]
LLWDQKPAQLIDLSVKGLRCIWSPDAPTPNPGEALELVLVIHDENFRVKGRVAGVRRDGERREVAMELGILPLDAWTSLQELIQTLEPQGEE